MGDHEYMPQREDTPRPGDESVSQSQEYQSPVHWGLSQPEEYLNPSQETISQPEETHDSDQDEEMTEADGEEEEEEEEEGNSPQFDYHSAEMVGILSRNLEREDGNTIFACGGFIPVIQPGTPGSKSPQSQLSSQSKASSTTATEVEPITIRWDPADQDELARHAKLVLPLEADTQDNLERLIQGSEPASFGYQGKDYYDETYRKALKMDTSAFATTFDPYSLGLIDTIAQVLLPSMTESKVYRAVRAELYKLNIYSGPSGKFKAHVDTPRSNGQFGSLVVCLPLAHEGGQLQVRHTRGRELTFDWGASTDAVGWAAFYSDCEHEVLEVTSGHRITLTYNLYAVRGNGTLAGAPSPSLDIANLPLYQSLKTMMRSHAFLPNGGHLGFYCSHAYPYTSSDADIIPDMLKGIDMIVVEAARRLGMRVHIKPVVEAEPFRDLHTRCIGPNLEREENLCPDQIEDNLGEVIDEWRAEEELDYDKVHWINRPRHKEVQMSYVAYGNQACLDVLYSYCAIIISLPPLAGKSPEREETPDNETGGEAEIASQ